MTKVCHCFLIWRTSEYLQIVLRMTKFPRLSALPQLPPFFSLTRPCSHRHEHVRGQYPVEPHWQRAGGGGHPEGRPAGQRCQHRAVLQPIRGGKCSQDFVSFFPFNYAENKVGETEWRKRYKLVTFFYRGHFL